ncbi:MAG TPA: hypothetical protein PKK05_24870, partial [Leptospiraceae bacterium]|nr:hypothetical protein [Leptospiraceae bacterium]
QRPSNMTSLTETNTYSYPVPAPGSGYFQNQYTRNYFWIYDDRGRIVRDSTYIYSYDSIGLLSYSKGTDNSIVEFFSR